ncbi:HAD hydrolase-like protein [Symbiopectobacterium sp.]|uniref:HAD hydrolase-like protein n=1 Tax=Symbiopectobacterium sp. TaxID=2952789 RepID=UPI003F2BC1C5
MHFYRPLAPIAAMTFDLDDTLYDNREVIQRTQLESVRFLQDFHPALSAVQSSDLQRIREALREQEPEIYHDVTEWRRRAVAQLLLEAGLDAATASHGAAQALGVAPGQILHVGDDLTTDVAGAVRNGLQACWINLHEGNLMKIDDARLLPHVEISRLALLTTLL